MIRMNLINFYFAKMNFAYLFFYYIFYINIFKKGF